MKKLLGLTLCIMFVMLTFVNSVYATTYNYDSFTDGNGYGTKTKVDDNITNIKGETAGPYSKASTAKLADGINEKVHVEINMEELKQGELFEVSLALKNSQNEYVSEEVVMAQKINDNEVRVTANGVPDFEAIVKESGVYTFQWEMFVKENKTFVKFTLLDNETVVGTTGEIDFDTLATNDTKNPIAEEEDVSVKYLWFCNVQVENGINVYAELPEYDEETGTVACAHEDLEAHEEVAATYEATGTKAYWECNTCGKWFEDEEATKEITDKTSVVIPKLVKAEEEPKDEEPKMGAEISTITIFALVALISLAGLAIAKKK